MIIPQAGRSAADDARGAGSASRRFGFTACGGSLGSFFRGLRTSARPGYGNLSLTQADELAFRRRQVLGTELPFDDRVALIADVVHRRNPVLIHASGNHFGKAVRKAARRIFPVGKDRDAFRCTPLRPLELIFDHILFDAGLRILRLAPVKRNIQLHIIRIGAVERAVDLGFFRIVFQIREIGLHIIPDPDPERVAQLQFAAVAVNVGSLNAPVHITLIGQAGNRNLRPRHGLGEERLAALEIRQHLSIAQFRIRFKITDRVVLDRIVFGIDAVGIGTDGIPPHEFRDRRSDARSGIARIDHIRSIAGQGHDSVVLLQNRRKCRGLLCAPGGNRGAVARTAADFPDNVIVRTVVQPLNHIRTAAAVHLDHDAPAAVDAVFDLKLLRLCRAEPGKGDRPILIIDQSLRRSGERGSRLHVADSRNHPPRGLIVSQDAAHTVREYALGAPARHPDLVFLTLINKADLAGHPAGRDRAVAALLVLEKHVAAVIHRIVEIHGDRAGAGQGDILHIRPDDRLRIDLFIQHEHDVHRAEFSHQRSVHHGAAVDDHRIVAAAEVDVAVDDRSGRQFHLVRIVRRAGRIDTGSFIIGGFHADGDAGGDRAGDAQIDLPVTEHAVAGRDDIAVDIERIAGHIAGNAARSVGGINSERSAASENRQGSGESIRLQGIHADAECALNIPRLIGMGVNGDVRIDDPVHGKRIRLDAVSDDLGVVHLELVDMADIVKAVDRDRPGEVVRGFDFAGGVDAVSAKLHIRIDRIRPAGELQLISRQVCLQSTVKILRFQVGNLKPCGGNPVTRK